MSWDRGDPRVVITRYRFCWSARVEHGLIVHSREDGGPFAFTRRGIERKARRMLRNYLRPSREVSYVLDVGDGR